MARNRRKKSLYEVISKTRLKSSYSKTLEQLHPEKSDKDEPATAKSAIQVPERAAQWPKRPRIVQFNAGRIEISMPYEIAIALLLGVVLLVLVVFRLGQNLSSQKVTVSATKVPKSVQKEAVRVAASATQTPDAVEKTSPDVPVSAEKVGPAKSKGDNRIVIQTYQLKAHLEPVKQYFAGFGIETEIKKIDDWYYLVTKNKYENPERPGTNGYSAKQKIIELGAKYKAPSGYETFGSKPFHDAYGKKFED